MISILTANTGGFPRIGEGPGEQKLRKALADLDSGKISKEDFKIIERQTTANAIVAQTRARLDLVTDGLVSWHDPISHILAEQNGVMLGSLMRFFDTNCYYRQPVIKSELSLHAPVLVKEFQYACGISDRPVKPVITGPYTLACHCVNQFYTSFNRLVEALTGIVVAEVAALASAGATVIQIDEPSILSHPDDMPLLQAALKEIAGHKGEAKLALYTYFEDSILSYEKLQQLPVDILGFDFYYSQRLAELISVLGSAKVLGLGLIDGRNTRIEKETGVFSWLDEVLSAPGIKQCYLNPSCGLEYLPRSRAVEKLKNMVRLRDKYIGGKHE